MPNPVEIDFRNIRPLDGDRRKGFEEFVCQIFRRKPPKDATEFRRVEGAGGDGGLESYWLDSRGNEHGIQAKYFLTTKDISWAQIDDSVKTAIDQHPALVSYVVTFACDLTGRSGTLGLGKKGWDHWDTHRATWQTYAASKGMTVAFSAWTKSTIIDELASSPDRRGFSLFWFNAETFDKPRFLALFERARVDLGERFHPEDNVPTSLLLAFEGLRRSPAYLKRYSDWFDGVPSSSAYSIACSRLKPPPADSDLLALADAIGNLRKVASEITTSGYDPWPISEWRGRINAFWELWSKLTKDLSDNHDGDRAARDDEKSANRELNVLSDYMDTQVPFRGTGEYQEPDVAADSRRLIVVKGEPGSGKSHLFADAAAAALESNCPALLLLGQNFNQGIRESFLKNLDLPDVDFDTCLQALDAAAEVSGQRGLILIDALNEAHNLRIWRDSLASFAEDVLKYPHLTLAVSLRPEYEQLLLPETLRNRARVFTHRGIESAKEQEAAAKQYFEKRGIARPTVPWLAPEFSNFLFLRTVCEALARKGEREFPRGLRGSLDVLRYYLESIDAKVRGENPASLIPVDAIFRTMREVAGWMAARKRSSIDINSATSITAAAFGSSGPTAGKTWFSLLYSEGVFRKDHHFPNKDNEDPWKGVEEVYRFSYQRFSDHLIARALLVDITDIHAALHKGEALAFLIDDKDWRLSSLWDALAVQIPEKFKGIEVFDVVPTPIGRALSYTLVHSFEQSLLWRSPDSFSDRTLWHFNGEGDFGVRDRMDILLRLATVIDHPWNALFLHRNLLRRPIAERDAMWSSFLARSGENGSHEEIVQWTLTSPIEKADERTLHLCSYALTWFFTSSYRNFRDRATKALIRVFAVAPRLVPELMDVFRNVDDLYVLERLCCAAFASSTRLSDPFLVGTIAKAVYFSIFDRPDVPLDLSLRDYAKGTIQYASRLGCLPSEVDVLKANGPHKSEWPLTIPSEDEIEKIAETAGEKSIFFSAGGYGDFARYEVEPAVRRFSAVPLNAERPLNDEEKQRAFEVRLQSWSPDIRDAYALMLTRYSDFKNSTRVTHSDGNETFGLFIERDAELGEAYQKARGALVALLDKEQQEVFDTLMGPTLDPESIPYKDRDIPEFNSGDAKRWVVARAYGYGWTKDLFPDDGHMSSSRGTRPKMERVGKKYQWLALGELQARLSDNVWSLEGYPPRAAVYDHPADSWFVRDVEPSVLTDILDDHSRQRWWHTNPEGIPDFGDSVHKWPFANPPPTGPQWLNPVDPNGKAWLLLYTIWSDRKERDKKEKRHVELSVLQDSFVRISSVVVEANQVEGFIKRLKGERLADPSGHETVDWTDGPFLMEYPWRNTWDYGSPYLEDGRRPFDACAYLRPVARHVWESHLDASLSDGLSVALPHPWIGKELDIRPDLESIGAYRDAAGRVVFLDPAFGTDAAATLVVEQDDFFQFLKSRGLECVWIIAGERNAYPSGHHGDYYCRSFSSIYRFKDGRWVSEKWHSDTCGHKAEHVVGLKTAED